MSKDLFSSHASDYALYRPSYPPELIEYIASLCKNHDIALDCATGNGQAAVLLSKHFKQVIGTDLSKDQIAVAKQLPNISYRVSPAESTPFSDNTFDLITIAQAYHWVKHDEFAKEIKRIGKPGAIIAVWGYNLFKSSNGQVTKLIDDFYYNVTDPYWEPERKFIESNYETAPFEFAEIKPEKKFRMIVHWSADQVEGYLNTWSAIKKFIKINNYNPISELMQNVRKAWGNNEKIEFEFPLPLRIGKL
ncbi:MAG TPA: class I SAM-dependent methyltransferase [Chitinophagaceae bacterium]|nr:class I SAM-dependent methyltransferase [Chitinophagaceae bacterium]